VIKAASDDLSKKVFFNVSALEQTRIANQDFNEALQKIEKRQQEQY
jgi:hypothetical protein